MKKRILLIGNGGREHALCDALARSPQNPEIFNFGNAVNPGIRALGAKVEIGNLKSPEEIVSFSKKIKPNFAVIGPEDPLSVGVADELKKIGIPCFGPTKKCAQLESSKSFTRNLLKKYHIPASPEFLVLEKMDEGSMQNFFEKFQGRVVVKADGLIGGKGVLVGGDHFTKFEEGRDFARESIEKFGKVVWEEKLEGEEFSLIFIVDGKTALPCPAIQDHKRAYEDDMGPNTGGMGCISDEHHSLPFLTKQDLKEATEITMRTMKALEQELGEKYVGVMYGGFMVTRKGVRLIEYNARFGDPEALNILPILKTDFVKVCESAIAGTLSQIGKLEFEPLATVVKYLCPEGYPTSPVKDVEIFDHGNKNGAVSASQKVFFASVAEENGKLILKGSRAIGIVGMGKNLEQANEHCEKAIKNFSGPLFYRRDIGTAKLLEKRMEHMKKINDTL